MTAAGLKWDIVSIPDGEEYKTLQTVESIYEAAFRTGLDRRSGIVAFGGGCGRGCSRLCRRHLLAGVKLVQVPTTLLAQVDSSVGGKVESTIPGKEFDRGVLSAGYGGGGSSAAGGPYLTGKY